MAGTKKMKKIRKGTKKVNRIEKKKKEISWKKELGIVEDKRKIKKKKSENMKELIY